MVGIGLVLCSAFAMLQSIRGDEPMDPIPHAPFQASLRSVPVPAHFCSGSIISDQCILTAAHCVFGRSIDSLTVVVGSTTINPPGPEYHVEQVNIYPSFDPINYEHNLALLKTTSEIALGEDVRVIPLPSSAAPAGELVILTGWRSDIEDEIPNDMQMARKVTIPNEECEQMHEEGNSHVHIHPTNVCARPRMAGCYCIIDAGSPLASENDVLIGVFSLSAGCGRMLPAVYTRVMSYRSWITSVAGI